MANGSAKKSSTPKTKKERKTFDPTKVKPFNNEKALRASLGKLNPDELREMLVQETRRHYYAKERLNVAEKFMSELLQEIDVDSSFDQIAETIRWARKVGGEVWDVLDGILPGEG